jgi:hypothetical protein
MALVLADRVLETTTTTGSGTITLAGAEPGYQSFAVVGNGNETYYTIAGDTEWEVGIGTYTSSGTTLSRDTVLSSSDSGNKVTFSAGVKKVFVTYPSEKSVNRDVSGNISASSAIITNVAEPVTGSDAATKLYVDSLVAAGITYHAPVKYEVPNSTGNLTATYNNGTAGVSATLTNAGTLTAFVPDGVTASISDRVLVYSQTNAFENGVYVVSTVGDGSTAWVLTRATDADTYGLKSPNSLGSGDAFFVTSGDTGAGETYVCNTSGVISFGSTAITFAQISSAQVYKAGNGISITNTTISLATPVSVANGGTGQSTTPTNGQLLIGNGTSFVLSTLTAGSGVSITNSAGSITLSATNSGAVTSVTATGPLASSGGATPDISIANSTGTGSVVLDQGATISSATITAAVSASITTITGTSANITTVTGTTTTFSSGTISQLGATSATITTLSGTNVTYSSGTVSQLAATSATIASVSGTNVTYSNANFTSATITTASGTNLSYGSLTLSGGANITGNVGIGTTSPSYKLSVNSSNGINSYDGVAGKGRFVLGDPADPSGYVGMYRSVASTIGTAGNDLTIGSYNVIAFTTGAAAFSGQTERMRIDSSGNVGIGAAVSATIGSFASANITTLTGTTFGTTATTQLRGASAQITTLTATSSNITTVTGTRVAYTSGTITNLGSTSANITTLTGTTFGTTATTQLRANSLSISTTGARWDPSGDIYAVRSGGTTGVIFLGSSGTKYVYFDGSNYLMPGGQLDVNGQRVLNAGNYNTYALPIKTSANWNDGTVINNVIGMLAWKNYGNSHVIFDASQSTAPNGTSINATNSQVAWTSSYPTLMGWNGSFTYGVRVDSCRLADNASGISSTQPTLGYVASGQSIAYTSQLGPQILGQGGSAAAITFHRPGAYAINLGLDTDNVVKIGGWSAGAVAYPILTSNNYSSYISGSSLKSQTFTSSGTFTVPTGITSVWVTMIGGGSTGNVGGFGATGGGSGAFCYKRPFPVTAGASLTVTIGGGGAGTATGTGNNGSATSFSSLTVSGGVGAVDTGGRLGIGGSNGGSASGQNTGFIAAGSSLLGGRGGAWLLSTYIFGGGGGGFGDGTDGGNSGSTSAAANSGAGSGGCKSGTTGAGGSGMVIVEWLG